MNTDTDSSNDSNDSAQAALAQFGDFAHDAPDAEADRGAVDEPEGIAGREPLPDAVRELTAAQPSSKLSATIEEVWRQLPAAEPDGTPPERGRTSTALAVVLGRERGRVVAALRKLYEAGVVGRGIPAQTPPGHITPQNVHYRVDTVDPALEAERLERERRELVETVPPARRVRPGGPTLDDPFAIDSTGGWLNIPGRSPSPQSSTPRRADHTHTERAESTERVAWKR